jgi:hypothetical protein
MARDGLIHESAPQFISFGRARTATPSHAANDKTPFLNI